MVAMTYQQAQDGIRDKSFSRIGEVIFETMMEEDNTYREIGKSFETIIDACNCQAEFDIIDKGIIALTGYSIEQLVKRMEMAR